MTTLIFAKSAHQLSKGNSNVLMVSEIIEAINKSISTGKFNVLFHDRKISKQMAIELKEKGYEVIETPGIVLIKWDEAL